VALVYELEERDLRVARQIDILRAIGYKLHKTTTSHLLYLSQRK
jgi:hypothetical protein